MAPGILGRGGAHWYFHVRGGIRAFRCKILTMRRIHACGWSWSVSLDCNMEYPIDGLGVWWGVVCNILRALTACPHVYGHLRSTQDDGSLPWCRGEDLTQPMHKWYNLHIGMFDVLTEADCRYLYAPRRSAWRVAGGCRSAWRVVEILNV